MLSIQTIQYQILQTEKVLNRLKQRLEVAKKIGSTLAAENIITAYNLYLDTNINNFEKACYETKGYSDKHIYIYRNISLKLDDGKIKKIKVYYSENKNVPFSRAAYNIKYDYKTNVNNISVHNLQIDHLSDGQAKKLRKALLKKLQRGNYKVVSVLDPKIKQMLVFM